MKPGAAGYDAEVAKMKELGFANYGGDSFFEHKDTISVRWTGYVWLAYCGHIHDDEREEGAEGESPTEALQALLDEVDYLDTFAEQVAATAATFRSFRMAGVRP